MQKKTTKLKQLRTQTKQLKKEISQLKKFTTSTCKKAKYFEKQSIRAHDKINVLDRKIERLNDKIDKLK